MPQAQTKHPETHFPHHIAIIMDGNGRWAAARHLPRKAGHQRGADALRNLLEGCPTLGVSHITVYAFSSENWGRPGEEVSDLMDLMRFYLRREVKTLHKNGVRIRFIGNRARLSADIQHELHTAESLTQANSSLNLTVALSYGSRQELVHAMQTLAAKVASGTCEVTRIDERTIEAHLDTATLPDPDLLIRTGGEKRLSNFLLWQSAYTELYFTDTLWPDFSVEHLKVAIEDFCGRERRFGGRNG